MITITIPGLTEEIAEDEARCDGHWLGVNYRLWERGRRCTSPDELAPGTVVAFHDPHWRRGPGVVEGVNFGRVWVRIGPRPNAHPTDAAELTVHCSWQELFILPR
jgi:hypothetical protein